MRRPMAYGKHLWYCTLNTYLNSMEANTLDIIKIMMNIL